MENYIGLILLGFLVCGGLGARIAGQRECERDGLILGMVFGPLGLLAAMVIDGRAKCQQCASRFNRGAKICPYRKANLSGGPPPSPPGT